MGSIQAFKPIKMYGDDIINAEKYQKFDLDLY